MLQFSVSGGGGVLRIGGCTGAGVQPAAEIYFRWAEVKHRNHDKKCLYTTHLDLIVTASAMVVWFNLLLLLSLDFYQGEFISLVKNLLCKFLRFRKLLQYLGAEWCAQSGSESMSVLP